MVGWHHSRLERFSGQRALSAIGVSGVVTFIAWTLLSCWAPRGGNFATACVHPRRIMTPRQPFSIAARRRNIQHSNVKFIPRHAATVDSNVLDVQPAAGSSSSADELEYVLPIGPACPFRSSEMAKGDLDAELTVVVLRAARGAEQFAPLAASFNAGIPPDPRRARQVGEEMGRQAQDLKNLLDRLESSEDFQAVESYHTLDATAKHMQIPQMRSVEQIVNWQASGLIAYTEGRPLEPPPPALVEAQQRQVSDGGLGKSLPSDVLDRMLPLTDEDFAMAPDQEAARKLRDDFERLVQDHQQLVGVGETYRSFDFDGKERYLEQMEGVVERWQDLFSAAKQIGVEPTDAFKMNSREYLQRAGLTPVGFKDLVTGVHAKMRGLAALEMAMSTDC